MKREKLKQLRIANGLTQHEMGEKLGYTRSAYNAIENGERDPHPRFWKKLSIEFKISQKEFRLYMERRQNTE